jgi:hypothetical protein
MHDSVKGLESLARVLVQVLELSLPIKDEELVLRLEFFENLLDPKLFSVRIWRLEHYRLQSTFPQHEGVPAHQPSDEVILKEFEGFESPLSQPTRFADVAAARVFVLEKLAEWWRALG